MDLYISKLLIRYKLGNYSKLSLKSKRNISIKENIGYKYVCLKRDIVEEGTIIFYK
jgi:hypothetical protein